jgi:hypothetical protein
VIKEKLLQAKALIEQERYTDARKLLKSIDHPTAKQWLVNLETIDPQHEKPKRKRQEQKSGSNAIFFLTILVLIAAIGGIVFFYLRGNTAPTAVSVVAASQPTAAAGGYPCEPQRWWDENAPTIYRVFQHPFFWDEMPMDEINRSINDIANSRAKFASAAYPTCLSELRDEILSAMSQWHTVWTMPEFVIIEWEEIKDYETADVLKLGTAIVDGMDTLVRITEMLDAEGIIYDATTSGFDGEGYLSRYRKGNTEDCPAIRWMLTDFYASLLLMARAGIMMSESQVEFPTDREVRALMGDVQREEQRLQTQKYPPCVKVQYGLMVETNDLALKMFQAYFSEGITYNTALKANDYLAKLITLLNTLNQIDTLDILPDTLEEVLYEA